VLTLQAYLRWCFLHESPPRVKELAGLLRVSRATLARACERHLGLSPSRLLKDGQLEFAADLLERGEASTTAVAYRAGFGTRATLFRSFRRVRGHTPRSMSSRATK
jgi:AraC-like DNA-binding protein